jgi:uncharacterized lipoprotein YbaY
MRVRCTIVLPPDAPDVRGKTVEVNVEDATRADEQARVLASTRIPADELERNEQRLGPLELNVGPLDPERRYVVRTRVLEGEQLSTGDLTSTQSHPLSTGVAANDVEVPVRVVE